MNESNDKFTSDVVLRAEDICKSYDGVQFLKGVSIDIHKGELVSILGKSGVGKTTLFNIMSGLEKPDSGHVYISTCDDDVAGDAADNDADVAAGNDADGAADNDVYSADGVDVRHAADSERRKDSLTDITGTTGHMSYMQQKDLLLPHKTILDNVSLPLVLGGTKKKEAREKAGGYFGEFGLDGTERKYPAQLSGGMRQRAALLRTYLCGKEVALLDEPFSALDSLTRAAMQEWYLGIMDKLRLTTIFVTHDIDEAILLSDRIYILGGSPACMTDVIEPDFSRPRTPEICLTDEFLEIKRQIRGKLM